MIVSSAKKNVKLGTQLTKHVIYQTLYQPSSGYGSYTVHCVSSYELPDSQCCTASHLDVRSDNVTRQINASIQRSRLVTTYSLDTVSDTLHATLLSDLLHGTQLIMLIFFFFRHSIQAHPSPGSRIHRPFSWLHALDTRLQPAPGIPRGHSATAGRV